MKSTRYTWCLPFYTAIVDGDWKTVSEFFSKNKGFLVALNKRQDNLAKELIKIMSAEDLSRQNKTGRTTLHIAASDGNIEIVKAIVEPVRAGAKKSTPVMDAASASEKKVVNYLYPITRSQEAHWKEDHPSEWEIAIANLLNCFIWCDFYGCGRDDSHFRTLKEAFCISKFIPNQKKGKWEVQILFSESHVLM
ncbi:hypothetical protein NE237_010227 [Protea cynaroides]|uniref:Uncharacterized protein n=1 Tax=Protea cynaroides TaxID=273540 RepID=A0A9Q0KYW7_9MAGN|nr:hypothetical protein NE237_010227 [Protea cynaroides]